MNTENIEKRLYSKYFTMAKRRSGKNRVLHYNEFCELFREYTESIIELYDQEIALRKADKE